MAGLAVRVTDERLDHLERYHRAMFVVPDPDLAMPSVPDRATLLDLVADLRDARAALPVAEVAVELARLDAIEAMLRSEIRFQCGILRKWRSLQADWLAKGNELNASISASQAHATRVGLEILLMVRRAGRRGR